MSLTNQDDFQRNKWLKHFLVSVCWIYSAPKPFQFSIPDISCEIDFCIVYLKNMLLKPFATVPEILTKWSIVFLFSFFTDFKKSSPVLNLYVHPLSGDLCLIKLRSLCEESNSVPPEHTASATVTIPQEAKLNWVQRKSTTHLFFFYFSTSVETVYGAINAYLEKR